MNFTLAWTEQQLTAYKRSHLNLINEIFHCIGIPSIVLSLMMMMCAVPEYGYALVSIVTGIIIVVLFALDAIRGTSMSAVLFGMYLLVTTPWYYREHLFWLCVAAQGSMVVSVLISCLCLIKYYLFRWREWLGLLLLLLYCGVTMIVLYRFTSNSLPFALTLFVYGWAFQFVGHVFEGEPPAFTKNKWSLLIALLWIGEIVMLYPLWRKKTAGP